MHIFSQNPHSEGAKALKNSLGIKSIKHEGSKFVGAGHKIVINWGGSQVPAQVAKCKVLNPPDRVAVVVDKLKFFKVVYDPLKTIVPEFTTKYEEAVAWVGAGETVVARKVLNGHSGQGIVIMEKDKPDSLVKAPLYVKYIPKKEEYRVHVIFGKAVDVQRKTLNKAWAEQPENKGKDINWKVRNLDNGFIYQRGGIAPSPKVLEIACDAVKKVGLDFGAVDIVVHTKTGVPYVLEINSAPGLQGQTIDSYTNAFKVKK